jgi:hypothetical protein
LLQKSTSAGLGFPIKAMDAGGRVLDLAGKGVRPMMVNRARGLVLKMLQFVGNARSVAESGVTGGDSSTPSATPAYASSPIKGGGSGAGSTGKEGMADKHFAATKASLRVVTKNPALTSIRVAPPAGSALTRQEDFMVARYGVSETTARAAII